MGSSTQSIFYFPRPLSIFRIRICTCREAVGHGVGKKHADHLHWHRLSDTTPEVFSLCHMGSRSQHVGAMSGVLDSDSQTGEIAPFCISYNHYDLCVRRSKLAPQFENQDTNHQFWRLLYYSFKIIPTKYSGKFSQVPSQWGGPSWRLWRELSPPCISALRV